MKAYIYVITHLASGRCYVGKAVDVKRRWASHLYGKQYISKALRKYGRQAFSFDVVQACDTEEDAYEAETWWIGVLWANIQGYGFNLDSGGMGGREVTETAKRKMGESSRKRWLRRKAIESVFNPQMPDTVTDIYDLREWLLSQGEGDILG